MLEEIYRGKWDMYAGASTKCGPFLIGVLLGYATVILPKNGLSNAFRTRSKMLLALTSSTIAIFFGIFGILPEYWYPDQGDTFYNTIYTAVFRTVFAAGLASIIIVLFSIETRINNENLKVLWKNPIWGILAKLTFWAYLVHMMVVYGCNGIDMLQEAEGPLEILFLLPAVFICSYAIAFLFFLTVESPFGRITHAISRKMMYSI